MNRGASRLQLLIYPPQPNFGIREWTITCAETNMQTYGERFEDAAHRLVRMLADTEYIHYVERDTDRIYHKLQPMLGTGTSW